MGSVMQCHESVTFFIFRDWGIVKGQKIKLRQILSPTRVNKRVRLSRDTFTTDRRECACQRRGQRILFYGLPLLGSGKAVL